MLRTVHLSFPRPGSHGAHRKSVIASPCPSQPSFGAAGLARESEICNYGNKVVLVRGVLSTSDLRFLIIWSGSQASTSGDVIKLVDYGSRGKSLGTQAQSVQDACRSVRMVVLSLQPSIHPSIHPFSSAAIQGWSGEVRRWRARPDSLVIVFIAHLLALPSEKSWCFPQIKSQRDSYGECQRHCSRG